MEPVIDLAQLRARRPTSLEVTVEAWGGRVWVGKMPALEKLELVERFETRAKDRLGKLANQQDALEFAAELLSRTLQNETGVRLFDSDEGREFLRLEEPGVLQPLLDASMSLNGLGGSKKN